MYFRQAKTLANALDELAEYGDEARILAGGTDVMIQLARNEISSPVLLHIEHIDELSKLEVNGQVMIGSLVSHRKLATSSELQKEYDCIRTAANLVGGWQTQIAGTIGGNICNASPAADLAAPLFVHGAVVTLQSKDRGSRELDLIEFLVGRRQTARKPDELLTRLRLESPPPRSSDIYIKVGRRSAMEIAIVGLALRLTLAEDGTTISDIRIATCAVGPVAKRANNTEQLLCGESLSKDLIKAAGEALVEESSPIDDIRGSQWYRRSVLPRVLEQALNQCQAQILS